MHLGRPDRHLCDRRLVVELGGRFPYLAAGGAGVNLNGIHYSTTAMT